jgi:tetratricopeptide (TPR) repeat protein
MDGPQLPANLILSVANDVLAGKIAASSRDYPRAVESLQRAIATEGKIPYMEPAFWYYPVRLSLGATQMEAGDAKGAAETFRENLRRNPRDGWTLFGLQQSLLKLNQDEAAAKVERQFVEAWKRADIQPNLSWY